MERQSREVKLRRGRERGNEGRGGAGQSASAWRSKPCRLFFFSHTTSLLRSNICFGFFIFFCQGFITSDNLVSTCLIVSAAARAVKTESMTSYRCPTYLELLTYQDYLPEEIKCFDQEGLRRRGLHPSLRLRTPNARLSPLGFGFDECLGKWSAARDDLPTGQELLMNIQDKLAAEFPVSRPQCADFISPCTLSSSLQNFCPWPSHLSLSSMDEAFQKTKYTL